MNFGALKSGAIAEAAADIAAVVRAVPGIPVKVILETGGARPTTKSGSPAGSPSTPAPRSSRRRPAFIPRGGATVADVRLMRAAVGPHIGVKASGGIRTLADTLAMLDAGANRIGTSASAAILAALD